MYNTKLLAIRFLFLLISFIPVRPIENYRGTICAKFMFSQIIAPLNPKLLHTLHCKNDSTSLNMHQRIAQSLYLILYVFGGQKLHAFGHLEAEAHQISVAQNGRITDDEWKVHSVTWNTHTQTHTRINIQHHVIKK